MSILARVPNILVVTEGSEETTSPFKNQEILNGSSPLLTRHVNCAISPSLTVPLPNEKGTISGGTVIQLKEMC